MQRGDASDALNAMNNSDVDGHIIAVGWGKAIKKLSNNPSMLGQAGGFLKVDRERGGRERGEGVRCMLTYDVTYTYI
jgi:hypothetical protein